MMEKTNRLLFGDNKPTVGKCFQMVLLLPLGLLMLPMFLGAGIFLLMCQAIKLLGGTSKNEDSWQ